MDTCTYVQNTQKMAPESVSMTIKKAEPKLRLKLMDVAGDIQEVEADRNKDENGKQ